MVVLDRRGLVQVKGLLRAAGYSAEGVAGALGAAPVPRAYAPFYAARLDERRPLSALVKLFALGFAVGRSAAVDVQSLRAAGWVRVDGEQVEPLVRVTPWEGSLVVHDPEDPEQLGPDVVTGPNRASDTLASLTVRRSVARALDLGTGNGLQALLAKRHAERVVAADINPRAVELAQLNAALNEVELDVREGDGVGPVAGEQFDLIVCNPPFVISPDTSFTFRDSHTAGDEYCRQIVRQSAGVLREGGFATILCNWICRQPDERWQPLRSWVEDRGCDALLLAQDAADPQTYALAWNEPLRHDQAAFADAVERWLDFYDRQGITAIGLGAIVLRRRQGHNWTRGIDVPLAPQGSASDHLLRLFAAQDHAPELSDDHRVLAQSFSLVDGHRLEQTLTHRGGDYQAPSAHLVLDQGIALRPPVDPHALQLLFRLEPQRPLGEIIEQAAAEAQTSTQELLPQALATIRRLHLDGFITPAAEPLPASLH